MAVADRVQRLRALAAQALARLFDQRSPLGRLALVQVLMLAGDTLVTISLAGSLFFSISPTEAKSKVLLYLVLTLAPFVVVSPLLGPLIDRTRGARRAMVVLSAVGRAAICPFMARDIHSLLLFPEAFLILVLSKLYLVTRGALVPEMIEAAKAGALPGGRRGPGAGRREDPTPPQPPTFWQGQAVGFPAQPEDEVAEAPRPAYANINAQLTLLGTVAGFIVSVPGVIFLRNVGAPSVLIMAAAVFLGGALAGLRLPTLRLRGRARPGAAPAPGEIRPDPAGPGADPDLAALQPVAHPEVVLGLTTMSLIRGLAGFLVFLLAFGLRRLHAPLWWYGLALGASGIGALVGLTLVPRLRTRLHEQQILLLSIVVIALGALGVALWGTLLAQAVLAFVVGVAGATAQPSFDAMTQRYVPPAAQGRAFARFAMQQQLVWVLGALIPVIVTFPLRDGDVFIAAVGGAGALFYVTSRRALRSRALPRGTGPDPGGPGPGR
jgi:hypothetical protein